MYIPLCVSLLPFAVAYVRHSPMGITISSQISDTPMSRIEFSDNNVVTMHFEIGSISVSYAVSLVYTWLYCDSNDITVFKHSVLIISYLA